MNLRQLEYFVCVAETLNFTKAAQKCFISQTAMSLQIKALENAVGVPLFNRDKHHVELTPAGMVYLNEARTILKHSSEASRLAKAAAHGAFGNISIGFIRGYEQSNFPETLKYFHRDCPNIAIHLVRDNMNRLYQRLEEHECDIVFNLSPYMKTFPLLAHRFLKKYPLYAVLYPEHPMSACSHLTYSDLRNEKFVIMQPKGQINDEAEEVILCYERGGFVPDIISHEKEVQTLLVMVLAGIGISILPEYAIRSFREAPNLKFIELLTEDGKPETLDFEICWSPSNANPALSHFLNWIRRNHIIE